MRDPLMPPHASLRVVEVPGVEDVHIINHLLHKTVLLRWRTIEISLCAPAHRVAETAGALDQVWPHCCRDHVRGCRIVD